MQFLRLFFIQALCLISLAAWANPVDVSSTAEHTVKSIETGTAAFQLRLDMIERAEKSIDVEYFIFHNSDSTRIFTEALIQKKLANPQIRIRLLVDYFGLSKSIDPFLAHALIERGIEVRYYNPSFLLNIARITHRNHRKILLIDEREALIGGRNMGDEYFDLKEKYNFMDRDLWVEGEITQGIAASFKHFWESKRTRVPKKPFRPRNTPGDHDTTVNNQIRIYERRMREGKAFAAPFTTVDTEDARLLALKEEFRIKGSKLLEAEPFHTVKDIRFVADGPDWKEPNHHRTGPLFYSFLTQAQKAVSIEVPYFYLQKNEETVFTDLKARGIEVNLLLNSRRASNEHVVNYITLLEGLKFSKMGFNLFLNDGTAMNPEELVTVNRDEKPIWMVHAKTMIVDDDITWIGTLNMDPRSVQRLNAELAIVIRDEAFTAAVKQHLHFRLGKATPVTDGKFIGPTGLIDPAEHRNLMDLIRSIKTVPFYIFENQI